MAQALDPSTVPAPTGDQAVGAAQRISTRVPTAVGMEETLAPHTRSDLEVGLEAARASPDAWKKNADLIRGYSHINTDGLDDDAVHEKFVNHLKDNLVWLHDKVDPSIRPSSKLWYDGARKIADKWAREYQYEPHQVAGVLAALSPQKDWFQNVDLGKRILDISRDQIDTKLTPEMAARMNAFVAGAGKGGKTPESKVKAQARAAEMQAHVDEIGNKSLGELSDPYQRAMWVRAYDEAHNSRFYPVVSPEGEFGDVAKTLKGKPQRVAWGSFNEIAKAIQATRDSSLENISRNMGGNHKVRNFYNNIISPNYGRDATVDTHAIAAANMIPAGSNHYLVGPGLGKGGGVSSSNATGVRGLYAHYIEAHRRAAEEITARGEGRLLPRELQSITWEGIRGTFTPEQKRDAKFVAANKAIWDAHGRGEIDAHTARERAFAHARPDGRITDPKWVRSGVEDDAE